jgi:prevent-host-death family protein
MKIINITELKNHINSYLSLVEAGEEIEVRKRNIPIAKVIPIAKKRKNKTMLGCSKGSVIVSGDLTEPMIHENDWEMHT